MDDANNGNGDAMNLFLKHSKIGLLKGVTEMEYKAWREAYDDYATTLINQPTMVIPMHELVSAAIKRDIEEWARYEKKPNTIYSQELFSEYFNRLLRANARSDILQALREVPSMQSASLADYLAYSRAVRELLERKQSKETGEAEVEVFIRGLNPAGLKEKMRLEHCKNVDIAREVAYGFVSDNAQFAGRTYQMQAMEGGASSKHQCYRCQGYGHKAKDCPTGEQPTQPSRPRVISSPPVTNQHRDRSPPPQTPKHSRASNEKHDDMLCFACGKPGHKAKDCRSRPSSQKSSPPERPPPPPADVVTCYNCGKPGHKSNQCLEPKKERKKVNSAK